MLEEEEDSEEDRIVNGYEAGSVPWYVALVTEKDVVTCGGTLINHRYVMYVF